MLGKDTGWQKRSLHLTQQRDPETVEEEVCHLGCIFSVPRGQPSPVKFLGGLHGSPSCRHPPLPNPTQMGAS